MLGFKYWIKQTEVRKKLRVSEDGWRRIMRLHDRRAGLVQEEHHHPSHQHAGAGAGAGAPRRGSNAGAGPGAGAPAGAGAGGGPMHVTSGDHIEAAGELPAGWEAVLDPASGAHYYANRATGETTWTRPTA